jgi:hypothetical protein
MDRILIKPLNSSQAYKLEGCPDRKRWERIREELAAAKKVPNVIIYLQRGRKAVEIARNVSLTQKTMFK